jgi:ribose-phosphate pyrophosphokinase
MALRCFICCALVLWVFVCNSASQIQGFFNIPVDNLYAEPLIVKYIRKNIPGISLSLRIQFNPNNIILSTLHLPIIYLFVHKNKNVQFL